LKCGKRCKHPAQQGDWWIKRQLCAVCDGHGSALRINLSGKREQPNDVREKIRTVARKRKGLKARA
tara:strand:+ start:1247 stop:1444 length:198 start_codon:yes stop_codon:yes gene_type:complete